MSKLVIVGAGAFADIAHEYFTYDSDYDVVGFSVEAAYLQGTEKRGLPVVAFEQLEEHFSPGEHAVYVASTYTHINRLRTRLARSAKERGYPLASYVSSHAFVWRNVQLGEHCFIFEDNTVQPFVTIGDNAVLWSGNHIGHHSTLGANLFISSHVVISGFCTIGDNCFLGVNATVSNDITIGEDCWIGPDVTITRDAPARSLYRPPNRCAPSDIDPFDALKVPQDQRPS
jgi:sugar O-acyltransferase (sialic acid O-acetyltransferase NeuD family)